MIARHRKHPRTGLQGHVVRVRRMVKGRMHNLSRVVYGSQRVASEAERLLWVELDALVAGGATTGPTNPSLKDLLDKWIKHAKLVKRTWQTDDFRSRKILEHFGAHRPARDILPNEIIEFIAMRRKQRINGHPVAPATVDHELQLIKRIYAHACENFILNPPYAPAQYVRKASIPNHRDRILDDDEFTAVLEAASVRHSLIFLTARYTGLRQGHLLSLRGSQIRDGLIHPPAFDPAKSLYLSSKGFGMPPMPTDLLSALNVNQDEPLFQFRNKPIKSIRTAVEVFREKAGVFFCMHDLRRTYGNHLRLLGVEEYVRMAIMGHSPGSVHSRYQSVSIAEIMRAGSRIVGSSSFQSHLKMVLSK